MTGPLTGRGVLLWLGGFFAFIIAVNVGFIVLSVDTFRGEDEQKPYLQGIGYNRTLADRAAQARIGWRAAVTATRLADGHVRIDVGLTDANGKPQETAALTGALRHPADENRDRSLRVTAAGAGRYVADAGRVGAGLWDVSLSSTDAHVPFEATARLWVP
ncbi:MAG TPA: FixH family protein [Rhizomicrobium sp.]